jgi:predicted transcriptional regulator
MVSVRKLGQLEAIVMDVLWDSPQHALRVRDVHERLETPPERAYTTVMTVLDNLHKKGWVVRHHEGKGYLYLPAQRREEAAADALREILRETGDPEAALTHFARTATARELSALRSALADLPE